MLCCYNCLILERTLEVPNLAGMVGCVAKELFVAFASSNHPFRRGSRRMPVEILPYLLYSHLFTESNIFLITYTVSE